MCVVIPIFDYVSLQNSALVIVVHGIDIVILFFFSFHYFEALGLFSFYFILIILFIKNVCDLNDLSYLIGLMSRAMLA